ncbi:MAG: outer membrane beta-barrel family protein, partial [Bacteroidetes bacterium]|nr:outer membrane beta-barrel family protein [Bacteroidota bacterium]
LINGRASGIVARNIAMALRQIPASSIKSVEVITSPGARYDAEGTAGIINIITKKKIEGLDGNLYVTVGNLTQAAGLNVSLQREKFGISVSGSLFKYLTIEEDTYRRENFSGGQTTGILSQQIEKNNTGQGGNVELVMDYYPDSTEHYTVWMGLWGGNTPNSASLLNQNLNGAGQVVNSYLLDNQVVDYYASTEINLGYTKTYPGKKYPAVVSPRNFATRTVEKLKESPELSIFGQYNSTPDSLYYLATQSDPDERLLSLEQSFNTSMFREMTIQTDYILPFTIGFLKSPNLANFSIGGKAIARSIASNFELETAQDVDDDFVNDPTRSNRFAYEQRVLAGYAALWLRSRRNWTFNLGGRAESTLIKGDFNSFVSLFENSYLSLIPTLNLAKSFSRAGTFKVGYTQRIFRPQIGYLNPYINYSDPNNLSTGNPLLDPELAHALEASHSLFGQKGNSLTTSAFYRITTGAIEYIREITPSGAALMKPSNVATRINYGLGVHAAIRVFNNFNITAGGNWLYQEFLGGSAAGNAGHIWNTTLTGSLKLGEKTTLQANGNYTSGKITFQGRYSPYYAYGFSARQEFWNKRASLTISVNNPLQRGVVQRSEFEAADFRASNTNLVVSRWGRLTFYWHFLQARELRWRESRKVVNDDKVKVTL